MDGEVQQDSQNRHEHDHRGRDANDWGDDGGPRIGSHDVEELTAAGSSENVAGLRVCC